MSGLCRYCGSPEAYSHTMMQSTEGWTVTTMCYVDGYLVKISRREMGSEERFQAIEHRVFGEVKT